MPRHTHSPRRTSSVPSQPATPTAATTTARQPKLGVLQAAAHRLRDVTATPRRRSSHTPANSANTNAGDAPPAPAPLVVESQRYEEWMKIATDNKITSTNTWNLALIDYFHDMSLLRNGDDNSINFQKASCTLDGCVKIWTSRVDSVASETGKLLSGLGDKAASAADGHDDDDDEVEGADGDDDGARQDKRARRRAARHTSTLADDFSKLRVKQFDLEFTVDPLFKKTSADFDEGGAGGILMNHLGCDGNMKVVFDAGDAKLECDDDDGGDEDEAKADEDADAGDVEVDISRLRARCLPTGLSPLSHMSLCPSLSAFRFSADSSLSLSMLNLGADSDSDDDGPGADLGGGGAGDFGGFDDDHYAGQEFGGGDDGAGEVDFFADQFTPLGAANLGLPVAPSGGFGFGPVEPFDPRLASSRTSDLVVAEKADDAGAGGGGGGGVWELLDGRFGGTKGWAGPEHWKMRRGRVGADKGAGAKKDGGDEDDGAAAADAKPARAKRDRAALVLDFSSAPALSSKELFAPANLKSSITSSVKKAAASADDDWTLPEDYQFNSQMLLRLFLKPKTTLRMRRRAPNVSDAFDPSSALGATNEAGAADVQFWAQAGVGNGALAGDGMGIEGDMGGMDPMDHDFGGGPDNDDDDPPPFDTQWLVSGDADDLPDPDADVDNDNENDNALPDDLAAATQGQLRRVRPEQVSYAKRAKRVDVKKLKDSIWKELEEVVVPVKQFPAAHVYDPKAPPPDPVNDENAAPSAPAKKPKKARRAEALVPVISSLRRQYPKEKMDEISTSYLFICLLHLANEKGLRIQTPKPAPERGEEVGIEEGEEMRKLVGGLEGLRVLKEVQA